MQALAFHQQTPVFTDDHPTPKPGPGEALIRPTKLGVCATDLELCKGYLHFDGILGHEFVGIVEKVADKAHRDWVGRRVVGEINCVCGACDLCKAGLKDHCRERTVLGMVGRDGCFAERFTLPVANLHAVPDNVDDEHAVFTEPLAAACQVLRQIKVQGRPYITVLGDGRLGLLCAQVLSKLNATVRVVGQHESKMRLCEKWGIPARPLADVGLRQDQNIVVDCTGSATGLPTAMQMVRPRGTIILKTTLAPPPPTHTTPKPRTERSKAPDRSTKNPTATSSGTSGGASGGTSGGGIDLSPLVRNEINLIGSRCGPFRDALQMLSAQEVDVTALISRRMRLRDGLDILRAAHKPDTLKVLVEP